MNFQSELRGAKQEIREWVRTHFSDQQLASVAAFNADGRMSFRDPCGCLMGVTYSNRLHVSNGECKSKHYQQACREDLARGHWLARLFRSSSLGQAERAYLVLGFSERFENCLGDDRLRSRRLGAILRAGMRRRMQLTPVPEDASTSRNPQPLLR